MTGDICTNDATPGDVLIQLSYPQDNIDGRYARLTIRDQMSGQTLVEVRLTGDELMAVMSTTGTRVGGAVLPAHPERIGKRSQNTATNLGRNAERTPDEVRAAYLADGWEAVRIDNTNFGHRVVAYRWIDDPASTEQEG